MKDANMVYIWEIYVNNLVKKTLSNFASRKKRKLGNKGAP